MRLISGDKYADSVAEASVDLWMKFKKLNHQVTNEFGRLILLLSVITIKGGSIHSVVLFIFSTNVYSASESFFHKIVKCLQLIRGYKNGGKYVKRQITDEAREELEAEMAAIFGERIKEFSTKLQKILLDDMVTAFENRLNVLNIAHAKGYC